MCISNITEASMWTTWAGVCHACTILTVVRIGAVSITAKLAAVRGCRRAACFVFGERPCFRIQKKSGAFESSRAVSLPVFRCPTLRLIARVHCSQRLLGHDRYKLELDATLWSIHSTTAKSKCCCSIQQRKGPGTKSIAVIQKRSWYKINCSNSAWTQLY